VIAEIDRLLNTNTEREIAAILNEKGLRSERARRLTAQSSCAFAMLTISKTGSQDSGRLAL